VLTRSILEQRDHQPADTRNVNRLIAIVVGAGLTASGFVSAAAQATQATVRVAREGNDIVVEYGPLRPSMHATHDGPQPAPAIFALPASGWFRGYRVELVDADGRRLPQRMLHHLNLIAVSKRDLFSNEMLRIGGAGPETADVLLPRAFGVEMRRGDTLAMVVMVHQTEARMVDEVTVRLRMRLTPESSWVGAVSLYPLSVAIGVRGQLDVFDLPPGHSEYVWEGSPAVPGRILGLGGHLHRYGVLLRLEDRTSGDTLWQARPRTDASGDIIEVPTQRFFWSLGVPIRPDHVYRLTAIYENPTGRPVPAGGMGVMGGVVMPSHGAQWPSVNRRSSDYLADRRELLGAPALEVRSASVSGQISH